MVYGLPRSLAGKKRAMKNEVGNTYGRLTVISFDCKVKYSKKWICQCKCGKYKSVRQALLRNGTTQSCGCLQIERAVAVLKKHKGPSPLHVIITGYITDAKRRGYVWDLDRDFALVLLQGNCYYCSDKPSKTAKCGSKRALYNGIDRIKNDVGYQKGNVVSCCTTCNLAKRQMSHEDFLSWIKRVYSNVAIFC